MQPMTNPKSLSDRITAEAIAGHEQAAYCYIEAISDLIPDHGKNPIADILIKQYTSILRILIEEWKEMQKCNQ